MMNMEVSENRGTLLGFLYPFGVPIIRILLFRDILRVPPMFGHTTMGSMTTTS